VASCESGSAVAESPADAIREALGSERTIGSDPKLLLAWIAELAAQYERESPR